EKYIPSEGRSFAFHGEILRRLINIQHQLLNNGSREQARFHTFPRYPSSTEGDELPFEWSQNFSTLPSIFRDVLVGHFDEIDLDAVIDAAVNYALECEKHDSEEVKEKSRKMQEEKAESERSWERFQEMETFM
ncbi:hypothetical protein HDV00_010988, partial [Rhizophlyctis rosea]